MGTMVEKSKTSNMVELKMSSRWADEVESEEEATDVTEKVPEYQEIVNGDEKVVIEIFEIKKDPNTGKKIKTTRTYKLVRRLVTQVELERRKWKKFGESQRDGIGPHSSTTVAADETQMQFIKTFAGSSTDDSSSMKLPVAVTTIRCRFCQGSHFSVKCPNKDSPIIVSNLGVENVTLITQLKITPALIQSESSSSSYVRPGAERTIRVSNLPTTMTDTDLMDLCHHFGKIERMYLAKDKTTLECFGYAYVTYEKIENCIKAIGCLNGYGYDHLIIKADWSKPT